MEGNMNETIVIERKYGEPYEIWFEPHGGENFEPVINIYVETDMTRSWTIDEARKLVDALNKLIELA
jgi:hypothetical protein